MAEQYVNVNIAPQAIGGEARHSVHVIVDREKDVESKQVAKFQSFHIGHAATVNREGLNQSDLIRVLWDRGGLSRMIPISCSMWSFDYTKYDPSEVRLGTFFTDHNPVCYGGPRTWPFKWNDVDCSLAISPTGTTIRVHNNNAEIGNMVVYDIIRAVYDGVVARRPPVRTIVPTVQIYRARDAPHTQWSQGPLRAGRMMHTVYIAQAVKDEILSGLNYFLESRDIYEMYGSTWKYVCLLTGLPGTGKSSTILAVATALKYNVAKLTVTPRMSSVDLETLFATIPERSFLLIEDVDSLFAERSAGSAGGNVDFSTLINCLDGITTREGLVAFMSTNHPEKLDAALVRPGRVDARFHFGYPKRPEIQQALNVLAADWKHEHEEFLNAVGEGCSIARLQQYLFICKRLGRKSILDNIGEFKGGEKK